MFDQAGVYVGMLAVFKINAAYVPLDAASPRPGGLHRGGRRSAHRPQPHARCATACARSRGDRVRRRGRAAIVAARDDHRLTDAERGQPVDELCYIIYTSGSTAGPRASPSSTPHLQLRPRRRRVYGVTPEDRVYQGMTIAFDFSVEEIWVPWMVGATLVAQAAGPSLLGQRPARVPAGERGHRAVLRADAAGHPRRGPARPALPPGLRRGVPAGPRRSVAQPRPEVPQRLRPDRGHGHRDLDACAPRPAGHHRRAAAHVHGRHPRPGRAAGADQGELGRDRHRRHRSGRGLRQPPRPDRRGLHPRLPGIPTIRPAGSTGPATWAGSPTTARSSTSAGSTPRSRSAATGSS